MAIVGNWESMWRDQEDLNRLFRPDGPPTTYEHRIALTKEFVLHLHSECASLLDAVGSWKPHRHQPTRENRAHVLIELSDIHKYVLSLYQIWGFTPEEAVQGFCEKSMVVRQRHSEEFIKTIDRPAVLVDLDGVLADYVRGFTESMLRPRLPREAFLTLSSCGWIDKQSLRPWLSEEEYDHLRHMFRVNGGFGRLPMLPGARSLMDWLHEQGYYIIILTSRPIHTYPNIYTDTLIWLDAHELHHDFIWWAQDKGSLVEDRNIRRHVVFAIDDDEKFVYQLSNLGIPVWWVTDKELQRLGEATIQTVKNLTELLEHVTHTEHTHE